MKPYCMRPLTTLALAINVRDIYTNDHLVGPSAICMRSALRASDWHDENPGLLSANHRVFT